MAVLIYSKITLVTTVTQTQREYMYCTRKVFHALKLLNSILGIIDFLKLLKSKKVDRRYQKPTPFGMRASSKHET